MKKNINYVWQVIREDANHLGGPMGTEYTTLIETKNFNDRNKAFKYLKRIAKKYEEKLDKKNWKSYTHFCQDITYEIVEIKRMKIN